MRRCVSIVLALCLLEAEVAAKTRELELRWNEIGSLIRGFELEVRLADGTKLKGEGFIRGDEMLLDVTKTSNKAAYPRGNRAIPRQAVMTIRFAETRGLHPSKGAAGGAVAGAIVGGGVAYSKTVENGGSGNQGVIVASMAFRGAGLFHYSPFQPGSNRHPRGPVA